MESGSKAVIIRALLHGTFAAIMGIPRMLSKRRQIMKNARISPKEMRALYVKYRMTFYELLDVKEIG